ncbi:MAG TPA: DUF5916 domain-containing protein [Gemmatimonadaceae bacterium]|nr:DUF5916 domain-containing protein [Gemmatimonadaceae bacterium]
MRLPTSLVLTFACGAVAHAQENPTATAHDRPVPVSRAVRTDAAIRLDGRLDEPAWSAAPLTDAFTQIDPDEGEPASERTEVRVLYDDEHLYVGVRLHDRGRITGRLGRRDMDFGDSDWFGVMIDSYHDHRTAFGFDVNPAGVRHDEIKTIDVDDYSWDPVWDVATTVDSGGWTAEYRIPFSQLRFSSAREQTWGVQFERIIGRRREYSVSTYIPKSVRGGVPMYGHLVGVEGVRAGKRLEMLPYTVRRASFVDHGPNPFREKPEHATSAGLDLLYRLSSNLTLNAAFNPDFGQVEVDPAVVNLGVYETFFDEKRPFFIEGSEIFGFGADGTSGGQIFYSRRIGRSPSLRPPSGLGDAPDATTILGAAKLSGKAGGWSLGILEAVTAEETARYLTPGGTTGRFSVEPLANYFVGRARREWRGGQTFFGGIVTSVHRDLATPEQRALLHDAAYAGGVDFRHEFAGRSWAVSGDMEVSRVEGSSTAMVATQTRSNHFFQRPDAGHLELDSAATALTGYSANLRLAKQGGEHWRGFIGSAVTSPQYEVNDLGFAVRTDRRDFAAGVTYLQNRPGPVWRRWNVNANGRMERNTDWQPILNFVSVNVFGQTLGYWGLSASAQRFFSAYDDRLTRGGPLALRPSWWQGNVSLSSDGRKPVTGSVFLSGQDFAFGGWAWTAGLDVGIKTSTRWNLTTGPTVSRSFTPAQFVESVADPSYAPTFGRRYVFAPLEQTSVGLETRLNLTFSPALSLETYLQPLLSSADYGDATQLVAPKSYEFSPYAGQVPDLDFNLRSLRGNAVLRWEWREGSTVYFAWQQSRSDLAAVGDFDFGRDRRALFGTRPDNIFLVKANFWMNP